MPNAPVSACLIGVTGFGRSHYEDLMVQVRKGTMKVRAATIINPAEAPDCVETLKNQGCEIFSDYQVMLEKVGRETQLCCIPTGIHWHAPMTIAALNAGCNVLVEKPAAATIQEVHAMQAAEKASGKFVAVGFQTLYPPETCGFKRELLSGRIGKLNSISCYGIWGRDDKYYARNPWAGKLKNGDRWVLDSPFSNAFAHWLNLIAFLGGNSERTAVIPSAVTAELYRSREIQSPDTGFIEVETVNGPRLYFGVTHASDLEVQPYVRVRGEKGEAIWNFQSHENSGIQYSDGTKMTLDWDKGTPQREQLFDALRAKINDPATFTCDLAIAAAHTLICNGAHESSAIHKLDAGLISEKTSKKGGQIMAWNGIKEALVKFCEQERLPAALGYPWARAGTRFDMTGYAEFKGGKTTS